MKLRPDEGYTVEFKGRTDGWKWEAWIKRSIGPFTTEDGYAVTKCGAARSARKAIRRMRHRQPVTVTAETLYTSPDGQAYLH